MKGEGIPNQPPVASFTYFPESLVVSEEITFDASASTDPDGEIISYEWDFGDGDVTNTTKETINHSYSEAGIYEVTLTVIDNDKAKSPTAIFDTGTSANPYPSIMGTHKGTIKSNHTVIATKLYTYASQAQEVLQNMHAYGTPHGKATQATGVTSLSTRLLFYWQAKHTSMKSEQAFIRRFTTLMRCSQQTDG